MIFQLNRIYAVRTTYGSLLFIYCMVYANWSAFKNKILPKFEYKYFAIFSYGSFAYLCVFGF